MVEFFKNSVAAKVSLVISLMVLLTSFFVGVLFYFSSVELFKEKTILQIQNRSKLLSSYLVELNEELFSIGEDGLKKSMQDSNSFSRSLKNNSMILGYQKYTSRGNTIDLYERKSFKLPRYFDILPPEAYQINPNIIISGPETINLKGKNERVLILKLNGDGYVYFILYKINNLYKNLNIMDSSESFYFAFNPKGRIIIHPQMTKANSFRSGLTYNVREEFPELDLGKTFNKKKSSPIDFLTNYRGQKHLVVFYPVKFGDKIVLYLSSGSSIDLNINTNSIFRVENILFSLLFLLSFTFLGWLFTRYLFKNLDEITAQARLFTQGEHDIDFEVKSTDEIGVLALTFQGMIRQVNERARVLRKSERRIREARDQAEQALSAKSNLLEDLRRQKSEVERVSKDKDDLLAIVSHDLKNPLAVVETSMDIILEEEKNRLSPMGTDLVRRSKSSARVALNLITDLLDLARLEGGIRLDFEKFSVDEMIDSVVDSFYLKGREKEIEIEIIRKGHYYLIADYGRTIQILSNILGNSFKFTPQKGKITVEISEYKTSHSYEGSNRGLQIVVKDTGPGIPPDKLDSVFNKFEQARKKDREIGTGLGLTICKNICELHNGDISASSAPGEGAMFTIRLPRLLGHKEVSDFSESESNTILVVNDDKAFRKKARLALSQEGFNVLEVKNGEEMFQALDNNIPQLIILDDDMPVKNGLQCLRELEQRNIKNLPIIFLTKKLTDEDGLIKKMVTDSMSNDIEMKELTQRASSILTPNSMVSLDKKLDSNKKTILIVDDEEGIRSILQENFIFLGFNCITAKNGVEGLFLFQKYFVDLVVSDIRMAEVDGLTLTKSIKKDFPDIPVILMSANVDNISENLSERLGITKLFSKPFDIDELNVCIRDLIGGAFRDQEVNVIRSKTESTSNDIEDALIIEEAPSSILLVDDSEDMQTLFRVLLRKEKLDLSIVNNGQEAVDVFKKKTFNVVFMDMNMPVMGGEEAARLMREFEGSKSDKLTHIVLLTADHFDDIENVKRLGFDSYIKKPLNKKKILKEIEDAKLGR